jgi:ABC-type sugar transport system substrate-binding protein
MKKGKILIITLTVVMITIALFLMPGCESASAATTAAATTAAATTAAATTAAATTAAATTAAATTAAAPKTVLGFTPLSMEIAAFQDVYNGVKYASKQLGVEVILDDPQMDAQKQASGIENMISAGANVICIVSIDIPTAESSVQYCKEKGIPVISLISAFKGADVYIRLDEYNYGFADGKAGAEYITKNLGGKANVAILDADSLGGDLLLRSKGMVEGVQSAGEGVKIVARTTAFEEAKALAAMETILLEHPECNYAVTSNEPGAYGALAAAEAAGKTLYISATGAEPRIIDLIEQGKIATGIYPSAEWMGEIQVEIANNIIQGKPYDLEYFAPFKAYDQNTVQEIKDIKAKYTK